jgi:hypothetical protein
LGFGIEAHLRIGDVEDALKYLEEFLPHAKCQAFLRKKQELQPSRDSTETYAKKIQLEMMELEWNSRLPAYFYGSLVVLLFSEIEIIIEGFAREIKEIKGISLALGDIAGSQSYSRLRKYVHAILNVSLRENSAIDDLQCLRNLYAHHGGDTRSQSEKKLKRIGEIIRNRKGVSKSETFILVDATYLRSAMSAALALVSELEKVLEASE